MADARAADTGAGAGSPGDAGSDLAALSKAELKAAARARGLPTTGTKAALLRRIEEHDRGGDGEPAPKAAEPEEPAAEPAEPEDAAEAEPSEPEEPEPEAEAAEAEPSEPEAEEPEPEADAEQASEPEAAEPEEPEPEAEQPEEEPAEAGGPPPEPGSLAGVAAAAARALADLTGRTVDAVSGVQRTDGGYQVTIEVLELSRVPSTTDVLATYEVEVDGSGAVTSYQRAHRYYRNQTTRE
ncbi:MAG TPA: gas vesicle protein GvpO [Acidimicrobiales bacterium]